MRYSHYRKFPVANEYRASLSRKERAWVDRWLDSEAGKKITVPMQTEIVQELAAWEKEHGFDGPYAATKHVPLKIEESLKSIMRRMDTVAYKQLQKATSAYRKEEKRLAAKKAAADAKKANKKAAKSV